MYCESGPAGSLFGNSLTSAGDRNGEILQAEIWLNLIRSPHDLNHGKWSLDVSSSHLQSWSSVETLGGSGVSIIHGVVIASCELLQVVALC